MRRSFDKAAERSDMNIVTAFAHGARLALGVAVAQLVEDGATDAELCVGGELSAALGVKLLDSVHEAERANPVEVVSLDVRRQASRHAADGLPNQGSVLFRQRALCPVLWTRCVVGVCVEVFNRL